VHGGAGDTPGCALMHEPDVVSVSGREERLMRFVWPRVVDGEGEERGVTYASMMFRLVMPVNL
jgi:hypothetical protein